MDARRANSVEISRTRSLVNPVDRTGNDRVSTQTLSSNQVLVLPGQLVGNFDLNTKKKKRPAPKPPNHQPPFSEAGYVRSETQDAVVRDATDDAATDLRIVPQAKPRVTLVRANCDDEKKIQKVSATEEQTIEDCSKPLSHVPFETKSLNSTDEVSTRSKRSATDERSSVPKAAPRPLTQMTMQKLSAASNSGEQDYHREKENEPRPDLRQKPSVVTTRPEPGPKQSVADPRSSLANSSSDPATITPFRPEHDVASSPDENVSQRSVDDQVEDSANLMKPKRTTPLRPPPKATTRSPGKGIILYEHSWTKL